MNFDAVVETVLGIIKRPDKLVAVQAAVNANLARYVLKTTFSHDLVEGILTPETPDYTQTIDLSTLVIPLVRFRKWKYLKVNGASVYLTPTDTQNIFTPGGYYQTDAYYMSGTKLHISSSVIVNSLAYGFYQYAPYLSGSQTHWLLNICPFCVINKAAADMLNSMGDSTASKFYLTLGDEMYSVVANDLRDQATY